MRMWPEIIHQVCASLDAAKIPYHADASSSFYVHGLEFDMADFDITVAWGSIQKARNLFVQYEPTPIVGDHPQAFQFEMDGFEIDCMSYQSETGIGPADERGQVEFHGKQVWSKKPVFYLANMRENHPLYTTAQLFFLK